MKANFGLLQQGVYCQATIIKVSKILLTECWPTLRKIHCKTHPSGINCPSRGEEIPQYMVISVFYTVCRYADI